ncbi:hypothetical protein [Burkholderia multivorans]|uniref:hypothetical protein n=1 Tax=Burkholderia multivorans TaxID=87883 RepID=UPI000D01F0A4|nr:hypothetical protein [Burkholderia multivorans]PRH46393.1 hypothetical protein C6V05_20925 [Burkholderia multivorans]
MTSKLTDEQIEAAKAAGFYWHPIQKCLCTRHSSGAWVAVDDMLARFVALLAPTQQPSGEVTGWQPIETAPVDTEVVVFWLDPESPEHPERYDFDMLDDGCWRVWTDHYEFAHSVAPAGSRMPCEQPPYTHGKPLGVPADAARAQGGES